MRVFLIQNVKGLWPSSGEWLANMNLLMYLASKGHATAQICYATAEDVALYFAKTQWESRKINVHKSVLRLSQRDETITIPVTTFSNLDKIYTIVLDQESFQRHYTTSALDKDVREYIEVSLKIPSHL
jgi:hypothetical protein